MKRKIYSIIILLTGLTSNAQETKVGIKTANPTETLDVNGSSYTNSLYLRNPGEPDKTGGHFLATSKNTLDLYDPALESSGLFNYIKLTISGVPSTGIQDYDTKIDASRFLVVVHNYSFQLSNGSTKVALDYGNNGINDNKQGSPNINTFRSNGTWHIRANFTDSTLQNYVNPDGTYNNFKVDLYLMAYKYLITKQNINDNTKDLGGTNGSAQALSKPSGF
ncbi:hypothetical protein JET18_07180 [Chryseobacterium sp. L7]|uniref:Uncharacterized protein n=1 Tax=Chryseobacterium endalhagicum TaxID=2797638 RepID=A0ABS1QDC3_9FLAO|nr:hypothetical protein [Chryseobacterium endalhagicum]MBL1220615.1 hypothetical protein [Chryseobacterium endalhagicum]